MKVERRCYEILINFDKILLGTENTINNKWSRTQFLIIKIIFSIDSNITEKHKNSVVLSARLRSLEGKHSAFLHFFKQVFRDGQSWIYGGAKGWDLKGRKKRSSLSALQINLIYTILPFLLPSYSIRLLSSYERQFCFLWLLRLYLQQRHIHILLHKL